MKYFGLVFLSLGVLAPAVPYAPSAQASEGGASIYLLGSGGPEAAILPPVEGLFFSNTAYYYSADAHGGKQFSVGGNVVAGLDATLVADFPALIWVPATDFLGGVLALGAAVPFGRPSVEVSGVITGPLGNTFGISAKDDATVIGDPLLNAALGWNSGKWHWAASTFVNVPVGHYREDQLANLAFHRWATDASFAATWHDGESGWDVSGKAGFTFNGNNEHTDYKTGTEFHAEAALEKTFSSGWSMGPQLYYFRQVTGDSGSGASLGDFKGEVFGFGGNAAYRFNIGDKPATLRLRAIKEYAAENRPEGHSVWLDFSIPLSMKAPNR